MIDATVILCGGLSQRMGVPKASLRFGSETLLQRVVRNIWLHSSRVMVVAAAEQELDLSLFPDTVTIARDPIAGQGPLRGIATGLASLPENAMLVYVTAVDAPFLHPRWIEKLSKTIGDHDIAVPFVKGRYHPLSAVHRRSRVLPAALTLLDTGERRLSRLVDALDHQLLTESDLRSIDPELRTLWNLNTPDEYRQALREAGLSTELE